MTQIIQNRSSGKTRELIIKASENPDTVIVARNPDYIIQKGYSLGITGLTVISYKDFTKENISNDHKYMINDLDNFVRDKFFEDNILAFAGYTLSKEN